MVKFCQRPCFHLVKQAVSRAWLCGSVFALKELEVVTYCPCGTKTKIRFDFPIGEGLTFKLSLTLKA